MDRILILCVVGFAIPHADSTLTYCLTWPTSMKTLFAIASTFALDIFSETKMPCAMTGFTYFTRILVAVFMPFAVAGVLVLGALLWSVRHHRQRRTSKISMRRSTLRRERQRGSHNSVVKTALWKISAAMLVFVDFIYPTVCRTLLQTFTCQDLGSAGWWLEAESVENAYVVTMHKPTRWVFISSDTVLFLYIHFVSLFSTAIPSNAPAIVILSTDCWRA